MRVADHRDPAPDDVVTTHLDTDQIRAISPRLETLVVQPWPVHRTRMARRWLVTLLVLLPVIATLATWWGLSDQGERVTLAYRGVDTDEALLVRATALAVEPELGELTMRMVFTPGAGLVTGDRLNEDVTLVVNDLSGRNVRTFDEGSVLDPITIVIELRGSSARYPFDRYGGTLNVGANVGDGELSEPLTTDLEVSAALPEFAMKGSSEAAENSVSADLDLGRRWAAITWVVLFMVISWSIALSCVAVMWWIVVFNAATPLWVYALFASVLFALPSLRTGLPGNPRYGVLVDWAAFYWSITVVAFSLVAVLVVWNVSARASFREALRHTSDEQA